MADIITTDLIVRLSDNLHRIEEAAAEQNFLVDAGEAPWGTGPVALDEARRNSRGVLAGLADFLNRGGEL